MVPPSFESKIGTLAYQHILTDPGTTVSYDPAATLPVQRVAARLIAAAEQSKYGDMARSFEWKVAVIEDPHLRNAVAYPGGKLLVYTGLFPVAKNEAGLAAVLAHEMVHVLARHSAEQMTHDILRVTRGREEWLPFSRQYEAEADYIGLLLTAEAGYDPVEAILMWERMRQSGDEPPPEFLSTHPSYDTRIEELLVHLQEARTVYTGTRLAPVTELPAIAQRDRDDKG